MFRTIADSLERDALVARLRRLTPASTRRWGTLTPHEMLCHLGDGMAMVLGDRPRPSPIAPRGRAPIKALFLWSPVRWPHGIPTSPRHDPRRDGSRPADFARDADRTIDGLLRLGNTTGGLEPAHGIFGPMSPRDWHRFAWKHTDYHLRQFGL